MSYADKDMFARTRQIRKEVAGVDEMLKRILDSAPGLEKALDIWNESPIIRACVLGSLVASLGGAELVREMSREALCEAFSRRDAKACSLLVLGLSGNFTECSGTPPVADPGRERPESAG